MSTQHGKLLDADLSSGRISTRTLDEKILHDYVGGSGIAARLFVDDNVPVDCDPLGPENNLYILTGPLTGSGFPATPRFGAAAKSPLTGIWGEANCGGFFGPALKFAGWDGIVVHGTSDRPVMLFVEDDQAQLIDASDLWGKDTYETADILTDKFGEKPPVRILSIGQAGENLVKYANIADGKHDYLGRTGLGAVMGSKKIKAIAVRGTGKIMPADMKTFAKLRTKAAQGLRKDPLALSFNAGGTNSGMTFSHNMGDVPIKNWTVGQDFELAEKLSSDVMNEKYLTRPSGCFRCPIACKRNVRVDEGPYKMGPAAGPEYETMASLGAMCMITNQAAMNKINDLCNRFGLDTISLGCTMAFAIDCYESGLLTDADTGGLKLNWGNADSVIEVIKKIAAREGIGAILAQGSRAAAEKIGKGAANLTSEVKGLEVPMHDPRTYHGLGQAYATSIRGACHLSHFMLFYEEGYVISPELGFHEIPVGQSSDGKGKALPVLEDFGQFAQTLGYCYFGMPALSDSFVPDIISLLNAATGRKYSLEDILRVGQRIWLLKRSINNMMGVSAESDRLPIKNLTSVETGPAKGLVPDIAMMIKEYYQVRGLDMQGVPKKEKLIAVGLADIAEKLNL